MSFANHSATTNSIGVNLITDAQYPKIYEATTLHAKKLAEGSPVYKRRIGFFSSFAKASDAISTDLKEYEDGTYEGIRFAFFVEEIILDCTNKWLLNLAENYHRTWLFDSIGQEICQTPGIDGLWQSGTTETPQVYQIGDLVAYIEDKINSKTGVRGKCLKAGIITVIPRRRNPSELRHTHETKFHETGADITDEYLWYSVQPSNRFYSDQQRCQTSIYPFNIKVNGSRQKSLDSLRRNVLRASGIG